MKNFDEDRQKRRAQDRSFRIGGEEFVKKAGVHPDVLMRWDSINTDMDAGAILVIVDDVILEFTEDTNDAHNRYRRIRDDHNDPLTLPDLTALVQWLIEEETGRPTEPPARSMRGPGELPTRSMDGSPSPAIPTVSPVSI